MVSFTQSASDSTAEHTPIKGTRGDWLPENAPQVKQKLARELQVSECRRPDAIRMSKRLEWTIQRKAPPAAVMPSLDEDPDAWKRRC